MESPLLNRTSKALVRTVLIALFAALSYVVLFFRIPYPAPVGRPFLHLGNAVVILAALLLGGWQGGLSGAIGMGLNDLFYGYGFETIKTVILKFGIGLFAGLVARLGKKHPDSSPRTGLLIVAALSLTGGAVLLAGRLSGSAAFAGVPALAYCFLLLLGLLLGAAALLSRRLAWLTNERLFTLLGAAAGIAWNVAGEFLGGAVVNRIAGASWQAAMLASLASLPATLINGVTSIVVAVLLYIPIRAALHRARLDALVN
ncbi:MAG TPA: ECF transporter S component [Firmicutes bacterium]|nr:ECF transporter S component [Bacillota bacterium]